MSKEVFEKAKGYYPELWSLKRLNALLDKQQLTQEEYDELTKAQKGAKNA